MALIRRTELHGMVYEPVPMDMEDVRQRAQQIRDEADAYASRVVREAQDERERLIAGAADAGHDSGYQDGHREGLAQGQSEGAEQARAEHAEAITSLASGWAEALSQFQSARDRMLDRARDDVLELACAIARKVVRRTVELDPGVVSEQLKAVLEAHARPTGLFVRVHPDDEAIARDALPELMATLTGGDHVELETDDRVPRGSCTALTEGAGMIDARIDTQLERIVRELLPDRRTAGAPDAAPSDAPDPDEIGDAA